MYENLEFERVKLDRERVKFEKEISEKEYRFKCLQIARSLGYEGDDLLKEAKRLLDFIGEK